MAPAFLHISSIAARRVFIAALSVALSVGMQWWLPPHFADNWLRDAFIRQQASNHAEQRITVVDIDEASLLALGPWPWPRTRIATLLESLLSDYAVRGVALDMIFPEAADPAGDRRLAALAQQGHVVMAQAFDYAPRPVPLRVGVLAGGVHNTAHTIKASGFIANHTIFSHAVSTGNIGFVPDRDGVLRHLPMWTALGDLNYPTLSLALLNCCAQQHHKFNGTEARLRIPFSRNWSAYTVISAVEILNLRAPADLLSGRLVLIGSSALGLSDRVATPLSASTSGVMVHATALSSLLDTRIAPLPGSYLGVIFSLLTALLAVYAFPRYAATANISLLLGSSFIWLVFAYLISPHDDFFSLSGPLFANLFLLIVAVPFDWQITQQQTRALLGTLHHYVDKSVIDELLHDNIENPLQPVIREVTTLIADMEGYTGQVESLSMDEAVKLTRDFLDCLTRPVLELGGTLDKYTGDGLVAFWGAPLAVTDHADLALEAAQKIIKAVNELSQARQQEGKHSLRVRIGIESGIAMAGDFGSSTRSIYTAVGDSVNVASRLQSLAKNYEHDIMIGQGTVARTKRHHFERLGEVTLRGKLKPTTLYTLQADEL